MLWKCCTQYASKFGKLSSGHRMGKVSFHSNPKERQCQECSNYCTKLISHASKFSSVQSLSHVRLFVTPWITARQASLSITNSCPSSQWCHPAISSSVVPFSSCPQSLPASESFPMSQLLTWGGQSTGVSALASFLPKKSQGWAPLEWTGWISLQSSKVMLNIRQARLQQYVNFQMFKLDLER